MLERLDQIDWNKLGSHVNRSNDRIPEAIRNLNSADPQLRQQAREFLIGPNGDWIYVGDTTAHIIPFVLELLADPDTPDTEALLLDLSAIAEFAWTWPKPSLHKMRRYVETYDALSAGLQLFMGFLDHASPPVRKAAVEVLKWLTGEFEMLLAEFVRRFHSEPEEEVQVALLMGMKPLLNPLTWARWDYDSHQDFQEKYRVILGKIIEAQPGRSVQVAAARASVEVFSVFDDRRQYASPKVPVLLAEEFLLKSATLDFPDLRPTWEADLTEIILLMKDLIRVDADVLLGLLREPTTTALQAHLIFRGLLSNTLGLDYFGTTWDFDIHLDYRKKYEGLYYVDNYSSALALQAIGNHELNHPEANFVRPVAPVLRAIVEHDAFWRTPTNLFSYYFGLPDSREAWRNMLETRSIDEKD